MAASQHPLDDRQHGHAIRRRQGGRTSIYHDQLYPRGAMHKGLLSSLTEEEANELAQQQAFESEQAAPWLRLPPRPVGSDSETGAY